MDSALSGGDDSVGFVGPGGPNGSAALLDAGACPITADTAARWIAFDSDRAGSGRDLYLVRADGSQLLRLTSDPAVEKQPAFSNSGTQLAFASDRSGSMQILVMDLGTGAVRQLTSLAAGADEPSWARDDSQIVFRSGAAIYVMNSDGSNQRMAVGPGQNCGGRSCGGAQGPVPNGPEYPVFSADGHQVLFDLHNEIDVMNADGTGYRMVIQNSATTIETPALSADGLSVAFAFVPGGAEQIAVAPFAGSTSPYITGVACAPAGAAPKADGGPVDSGSTCDAEPGSRPVTPLSSGSARRPAWGPGGVMAFEHGSVCLYCGWSITTADIALVAAPGSTPCEVIGLPGDHRNPSWAPVGFQPSGASNDAGLDAGDGAAPEAGDSSAD